MKKREFKIFFSTVPNNVTNENFVKTIKNTFSGSRVKFLSKSREGSNRYGYIQFKNKKEMKKAIDYDLNFSGKRVVLQEYLSGNKLIAKQKLIEKSRIFIKKIPEDYSDVKLKKVFEKFGEVISAFRAFSAKNPANFGFVTFKNPESVMKCINKKVVIDDNENKFLVYPFIRDNNCKKENNNFDFSGKNNNNDMVNQKKKSNNLIQSEQNKLIVLRKTALLKKFSQVKPTNSSYYDFDRELYHSEFNIKFKPRENAKKFNFYFGAVIGIRFNSSTL